LRSLTSSRLRAAACAARGSLVAAVPLALLLSWSGAVLGRSEAETSYTREQTFSAALRYLRVDLAYEVTEKDPDAAYLLFSFPAPELEQKTGHGSIEIVERDRTVRVLINLPQLPSYREDVLKRGLLDKLRLEYGEPAAPAERRKPEKPDKPEKPAKPDGDAEKPPAEAPEAP
jgi:hypothetical protein